MQPKGLICAGGEATRLGELTRVANKHLLPVGSWPMIYYPLQLLQLAGIRDVLLVTGKGHAGQMIDLLGDGRLAPRGGGDPILELDLAAARVHARLWADLQSTGALVGAHDLWIAATALAHSLTIMSTNARDFGRIPGLALEAVTSSR